MPTIQDAVTRHVMVDIETLGTDNNAFITSIAAVAFDPLSGHLPLNGTKKWVFDPWGDQLGAVVDGRTVEWRQKQHESSKNDLRLPPTAYENFATSLVQLRDFIGDSVVWANSPEFDLVILNNAAKRVDQPPVAKFWNHRDVRTAKMMLAELTGEKVEYENSHDPVDDCVNQIRYVVVPLYEALNERRTTGRGESEGGSCSS